MPRLATITPLLALAAACLPVMAQPTWICGLSDDLVRLVCIADADPVADAVVDAPVRPTVVKGTSFPLDPRRTWTVPLWSPPTDQAWVELLARSTICFRTPDCEVVLVGPQIRGR